MRTGHVKLHLHLFSIWFFFSSFSIFCWGLTNTAFSNMSLNCYFSFFPSCVPDCAHALSSSQLKCRACLTQTSRHFLSPGQQNNRISAEKKKEKKKTEKERLCFICRGSTSTVWLSGWKPTATTKTERGRAREVEDQDRKCLKQQNLVSFVLEGTNTLSRRTGTELKLSYC